MSNIKNEKNAKGGLSLLLSGGLPKETPTTTPQKGLEVLEDKPSTSEEILETLSDETRSAVEEQMRLIKRRQYIKAGRPPKGKEKGEPDYVRMTFLIDPQKQEKLREISLREGLFIKEILDRGIDLVISEYEGKEVRR